MPPNWANRTLWTGDNLGNLPLLCASCNRIKGDRPPGVPRRAAGGAGEIGIPVPPTDEREYAIELPGVPSDLQSRAERDIELLAGCIAAVAKRMGSPFMLKLVRVTDRFQDDVNQFLERRSGHAGYVATRSNVRAIGKTLWTRSKHGDLGFAVIIDANQMGPWALKNPSCLTTILHELSHVLYEVRHIERLGEEEYCSGSDTREHWLDGWAMALVDEFDVNRLVDRVVGVIAPKDDGQPWSLRELEEAQGVDWVLVLRDALLQMPSFVDEKVLEYRNRRMGIDDLAATVIPAVKEVLVLLSYTAAMYKETARWPEIAKDIEETEASQRFFKEHLDTILGQLSDRERPLEMTIQTIGQAIEGMFHNCGLGFRTVPERVYISVGPALTLIQPARERRMDAGYPP